MILYIYKALEREKNKNVQSYINLWKDLFIMKNEKAQLFLEQKNLHLFLFLVCLYAASISSYPADMKSCLWDMEHNHSSKMSVPPSFFCKSWVGNCRYIQKRVSSVLMSKHTYNLAQRKDVLENLALVSGPEAIRRLYGMMNF